MMGCDVRRRHIKRYGRLLRSDIDTRNRRPGRGHGIGQKGKFIALCIGGSDDIDPLHGALSVAVLAPPGAGFKTGSPKPLQKFETRVSY